MSSAQEDNICAWCQEPVDTSKDHSEWFVRRGPPEEWAKAHTKCINERPVGRRFVRGTVKP